MKVSNQLISDVIRNKQQITFLRGQLLMTIGQYHPELSLQEIRKSLVETIAYIDELEGKGDQYPAIEKGEF